MPEAAAGVVLAALGLCGLAYAVPTLSLALIVAVALLIVSFAIRRPLRLTLADVWTFGFVYLFLSELALSRDGVELLFGADVTNEAEAFIVAAFGFSLLGYAFVVERGRQHWSTPAPPRTAATRVLPARQIQLPVPLALVTGLMSITVVLAIFFALNPSQLLDARYARDFSSGPLLLAIVALMIVQCVAAAYCASRYNYSSPLTLAFIAVSGLSLVALYAMGTRYFLGYALTGILFYAVNPLQELTRRRAAIFVAGVLALAAMQAGMRASRTVGLADLSLGDFADRMALPESYLSSEGMLRINAWVHEKRAYELPNRPFSNGFTFYWWVPRSLWPDKPTMDGNWLLYEVMDETGFREGHSVAGSFAMPALLDFGPYLGSLFAVMYGALLAALELYALRHGERRDPYSPITALLPFGVFFMVRSLQTSVIFLTVCTLMLLPFMLVAARGAPGRAAAVRVRTTTPMRLRSSAAARVVATGER